MSDQLLNLDALKRKVQVATMFLDDSDEAKWIRSYAGISHKSSHAPEFTLLANTAQKMVGELREDYLKHAELLAGMTYEYAVQFKNEQSGKWRICRFYGLFTHGREWFGSREEAEQQITRSYPAKLVEPRPYRIIRRLVSDEEIVG